MSTRKPDAYERAILDEITGPEGSRVRILPLGDDNEDNAYEGILSVRVLGGDRTLDAVVIDNDNGVRVTLRWAAIESLAVLPEETS